MKVMFSLIALLMLRCVAAGQDIPKKCDEIRVKGIDFKTAVNSLLDHGFSIERIDSNFLTVRTEPKKYSKTEGGMIAIDVRINDSVAIISGFCGLRVIDFERKESSFVDQKYYYPIQNRGMKGSLLKEAFDKMNEFARSLGNDISYHIKE